MSRVEEIAELIIKGDNRLAIRGIKEIISGEVCGEYGKALGKICIIEAVKVINNKVAGFYCDTDALAAELFSENPPSEETLINGFCVKVREEAKNNIRLRMGKAKSFIDKNICSNQLSVYAAAEFAGLSQCQLIKLFREYEGVTPGEYIGKLRCARSEELLVKGLSVEKSAEQVGFGSCEGYIRMFKKLYKTTPGEWKRMKQM